MGSSILSKAEIDALLHAGSSQSFHEGLMDVLTLTTENMTTRLRQSIGKAIEVDGPYMERVTQGLDQVVSDEAFAMVADVGGNELLMLLSTPDANFLGAEWNVAPNEATQLLGQAWTEQLADVLGLEFSVYQVQSVNASFLGEIPLDDHSFLIRHLIRFGDRGLELCLLIQGSQIQNLVPRVQTKTTQSVPLETQKLIAQGRLLKGAISPVSEATFSPLNLPPQASSDHSITLVEDIDLLVTVELGQTDLTLNEILELRAQDVITIDRHVGEPVDVYVNNKQVAKGEVVVLEEHFGVRILEIIPKSERIRD